MDILDKYFKLQSKMSAISKTNCTDKEIKQYFESGEKILDILDKVVAQFNLEWGETPPVMYCRDELPDMYMRYGKWDKARNAINRCFEVGILDESERFKQQNWINSCEAATKEVINHLNKYPGTLQKDIYNRLHYVDKESLKWVLRFYKNIEKLKYKNTNKLFLPEQKKLILEEKEKIKKESIKQKSENTNNLLDISTNIVFPNWYISISFGKSTSKNYETAVYLAKIAPQYIYTEKNNNPIHQAIYSNKPNEYLQFIKLYELVSNWKSTTVIINGQIVDRKIVNNLNYCYGDKCRTGKSDFCYGASQFTSNPFGCHRAQMHDYNDPWYSFGIMDTKGIFHIDKDAIKKELLVRLEPYKLCPALNMEKILSNVDKLPDTINPKEDKNWEYTTIMKNGIPIEGVRPTMESRGLVYTINLNVDMFSDANENVKNNNVSTIQYLNNYKKSNKNKRSFLNKIVGIFISLIAYTILMYIPVLTIENAALGVFITMLMLYPAFKIGFKFADKIFNQN